MARYTFPCLKHCFRIEVDRSLKVKYVLDILWKQIGFVSNYKISQNVLLLIPNTSVVSLASANSNSSTNSSLLVFISFRMPRVSNCSLMSSFFSLFAWIPVLHFGINRFARYHEASPNVQTCNVRQWNCPRILRYGRCWYVRIWFFKHFHLQLFQISWKKGCPGTNVCNISCLNATSIFSSYWPRPFKPVRNTG